MTIRFLTSRENTEPVWNLHLFFFSNRASRVEFAKELGWWIGRGKLAIARWSISASHREGKSSASTTNAVAVWVVWWRKVLFSKAELDVRPPPTRRDHLAGDQCSGADKSHERARLGPSAGRSSKGPHDEGGAFWRRLSSFHACLSFLLRALDDHDRRNRQFEPRPRSQQVHPALRRSEN